MNELSWGTLIPDELGSLRRMQSLGLQAAVRHFNDRSVPGLGGLWFPMPLIWSILAVSLAEKMPRNQTKAGPMQIANAIEAYMMMSYGKTQTSRTRGSRKLARTKNKHFSHLAKRGTYVTQPFRMGMVQPLQELGYVTGSRFGAFRLAEEGHRIMNLPDMKKWEEKLQRWITGNTVNGLGGLSPFAPLPEDIRKNILTRIETASVSGRDDATRRSALIKMGIGPNLELLDQEYAPEPLSTDHWIDLRAGAALMDLREAAIEVLRQVESVLLKLRDDNKPLQMNVAAMASLVATQLAELKSLALRLKPRIDAAKESLSMAFVAECHELTEPLLLRKLIERDGNVVMMRDGMIVPGPAAGDLRPNEFLDEDASLPVLQGQDAAFAPQLFRLRNLHSLVAELRGLENPQSPGYPESASK